MYGLSFCKMSGSAGALYRTHLQQIDDSWGVGEVKFQIDDLVVSWLDWAWNSVGASVDVVPGRESHNQGYGSSESPQTPNALYLTRNP